MKLLALDLSTSSGVSIFESGQLKDYTIIKSKVKGKYSSETYPQNYIDMAKDMAFKIRLCVEVSKPEFVVIEETNCGKDRYSQKQLEFIHFAVCSTLNAMQKLEEYNFTIHYIDSSSWRSILGLSLDSDQRSSNKERKKGREAKRQEVAKAIYNQNHNKILRETDGLGKRDSNKIIKRWDREIKKMVGKEMRKFRSPIKVTDSKTLSVNYVNEVFKLDFKRSQNDVADSICVGYAFILNNYNAIAPK